MSTREKRVETQYRPGMTCELRDGTQIGIIAISSKTDFPVYGRDSKGKLHMWTAMGCFMASGKRHPKDIMNVKP